MKKIFLIALATVTLTVYGQDKYNYVHFNKLTEVAGTEYVIASVENWGKMFGVNSRYLLFINTKTGEANQVDFPHEARIEKTEQIKIDSLGINLIVVSARLLTWTEKMELTGMIRHKSSFYRLTEKRKLN
jgi:ligand-binding sensor domain-containing protein